MYQDSTPRKQEVEQETDFRGQYFERSTRLTALLEDCQPSEELIFLSEECGLYTINRNWVDTSDVGKLSSYAAPLWVKHFESLELAHYSIEITDLANLPLELLVFLNEEYPAAMEKWFAKQGITPEAFQELRKLSLQKLWDELFPSVDMYRYDKPAKVFTDMARQTQKVWREYRHLKPSSELLRELERVSNAYRVGYDELYDSQYNIALNAITELFLHRYERLTSLETMRYYTSWNAEQALELFMVQTEFVLDQDEELSAWCRTPLDPDEDPIADFFYETAHLVEKSLVSKKDSDGDRRQPTKRKRLRPHRVENIKNSLRGLVSFDIERSFPHCSEELWELVEIAADITRSKIQRKHGVSLGMNLAQKMSTVAQALSGVWIRP